MPELPEVEIARRNLARWSGDRRVTAVRIEDPAAVRERLTSRPVPHPSPGILRAIRGAVPDEPVRHGKRMGWRLGEVALLVHLGMSGKWVRRGEEVPRFGRVALGLDDGAWLWLVDPRRFGCVVPVPDLDALSDGLGPDALTPLAPGELRSRLATRRPIKEALMDQSRIAGVGNIQAAEVLWRARLHPRAPADGLPPDAWERLAVEIPAQLRASIAQDDGEEITYLQEAGAENPFAVYGREGEACLRCGTTLLGDRLGGRATAWCPDCQRDGSNRSR